MAVHYTPPRSTIDDLWGTSALSTYDPLADGLLMKHQRDWVEDDSDLKIGEKGRRTGITWGEAFASVLAGAAAKSAGGDNTWYIGDTKEKGREFIKTSADFAQALAGELLAVEEFLFEDVDTDGQGNVTTKQIAAFRITFASGHRIAALSSNPANIRGLQGRVVIDEAAFHRNVAAVIDACLALLIWGGKIRIISTHNGNTNAFNELIKEVRGGQRDASIHHVTFDDAVANGLYERMCAVTGRTPSPDGKVAWYNKIRRSYGARTEAMREELDAVPREGDGTMLPLALIEAAQQPDYILVRWEPPAPAGGLAFVDWPEQLRRAHMELWLAEHVFPVLEAKFPQGVWCAIGGDFAMRQDRSDYACGYTDQLLHRHVPLIVEMRTCPYDQQKQGLFAIGRWMRDRRRLQGGVLDANGNGMVLAQESRQQFGADRIVELMPSDAWSREMTPKLSAAFEDKTIHLPAHVDVRNDLHQFRIVNGVGKIPRDVRTEGVDGGRRHADSAVAIQNFYAATLGDLVEYSYQPAGAGDDTHPDDDEGRFGQGAW
jgi:phage FluMu gp28-like protein